MEAKAQRSNKKKSTKKKRFHVFRDRWYRDLTICRKKNWPTHNFANDRSPTSHAINRIRI